MGTLGSYFDFDSLLERLIALLAALILHDLVQASTARLMGDRIPVKEGRLTINPLPFLDLIGLAAVLFGPFGWSREVPLTPAVNTRGRLRSALVYLTGPLYFALAAILFWWLYFVLPGIQNAEGGFMLFLQGLFHQFFLVHALLLLFNLLLPFYPTDLWKMIRSLLLEPRLPAVRRYEKLGLIVVLPILVLPGGQQWLKYLLDGLTRVIMNIFA